MGPLEKSSYIKSIFFPSNMKRFFDCDQYSFLPDEQLDEETLGFIRYR